MGKEPSAQLLRYMHAGRKPVFDVYELASDGQNWVAKNYQVGAAFYNTELISPTGGSVISLSSCLSQILDSAAKLRIPTNKSFHAGKDGGWHRLDLHGVSESDATIRWWCDFIADEAIPRLASQIEKLVVAEKR